MIAAAVLAAGRGARLGGDPPKPLRALAGRPLVDHAVQAALGSGLRPVLVVVGHRGEEVAAALPAGVEVVASPAWAAGIAASLGALLAALEPRPEVDGVVVGLGDQPLVGAAAYRRVAAAYDGGASLAVATYDGARANPVLLARARWREARALVGDEGARVLLRRHPVVEVACDGTGDPADVDTPEDLMALEARCASKTPSE